MENLFYAVPLLGLVGLAVMAVKASWVSKQPAGDETWRRRSPPVQWRS